MEKEGLTKLVELAKLDLDLATIQFPLEDVTILNLSGCGLEELPVGFEKAFPNLSILFLSGNRFREMPKVIGDCPRLQMVAFKSNQMESIHPDALKPQLRWLILTDNSISEIPDTIGRCKLLQKCMLSGNRLRKLPETIGNCKNLELIRLASNQLAEPPTELLQLPLLAWVGLSDNDFMKPGDSFVDKPLQLLDGIDNSAGEVLGQGAGGVTRKVSFQGRPVAVKTFGAAMTSDGKPAQERTISCVASTLTSPALIEVLGQTPDGSLVMEFLDQYEAIAGPPSMESCSRDVYSPDMALTRKQGISIVTNLLQAMAQLHQKGIAHGDFYGHNILVHKEDPSQVRLSDFGAAFFYDKEMLPLLERIELRAFAIFVQEICDIVAEEENELPALVDRCLNEKESFDSVFIWWKQRQLKDMALAFGSGVDENSLEETKM